MTTLYFELTLLEPVVLLGTEGRVTRDGVLPFVPGANLLGVAARHYPANDDALAWRVFHSGAVRFGDATPLGSCGTPALPIPQTLVVPRGTPATNLRHPGVVRSCADGVPVRHKPLRGFVDRTGDIVRVETEHAIRTAIAYDTQRAMENHLFDVPAVASGQKFGFSVEIDGDDAREVEFVREALTGETRMGRGRNAGRGRVRIAEKKPGAGAATPWRPWETVDRDDDGRAYVLFLSETCLLDALARPTSDPRHLPGLPDTARFEPELSHVRTVRWTPFNSHLRRPDLERLAIAAGSVATFSGLTADDVSALQESALMGVGAHRAEGLGRVMVQPAILCPNHVWADAPKSIPTARHIVPMPEDELGRWLQPHVRRARNESSAYQMAREARGKFRRYLRGSSAPSASQWRAVHDVARGLTEVASLKPAGLRDALFDAKDGICTTGVAQKTWQASDTGSAGATLQKLVDEWLDTASADTAALALAFLAKSVVREVQRGKAPAAQGGAQ